MGEVSGGGTLFCHKNIMRPKSGSHFVVQKRNKITRFSPISQSSNQVFENEEVLRNKFKAKSIMRTP